MKNCLHVCTRFRTGAQPLSDSIGVVRARPSISQSASQDFGSRMRTPVLVPGVFLLSAAIWQQTLAPDCCPIQTVKDASEEDSHLNGVYTLKAKMDSKPSPECVDGCVYMRDNREYCFKQKLGATAVCEVSTLSFTALLL